MTTEHTHAATPPQEHRPRLYFIEAFMRQVGDHQLMLDVDEAILTTPDAAQRRSKVEQLLQGAIENARKT